MLNMLVYPADLYDQSGSSLKADDDKASPSATVRTDFLWKVETFPIIDQLLQFPREVLEKSLRKNLFSYSVLTKEVTPTLVVTTGWGEEFDRLAGEARVNEQLKKNGDDVEYSFQRIPQLYEIYRTLAGNFPHKVLLERLSKGKETLLHHISNLHKELDQLYSLFFQTEMQRRKLFISKICCEMTKDEKIDYYQEKLTEHNTLAAELVKGIQVFFSTPALKKISEETISHEFYHQAQLMMNSDQTRRLNNFVESVKQLVDLKLNESPESYLIPEERDVKLRGLFSNYFAYHKQIGSVECVLRIALTALVEIQYYEKVFSIADDLGIKPSDDEAIRCCLSNLLSKL